MIIVLFLSIWLLPIVLSAILSWAMLPEDTVMADLLDHLKFPPLWLPLINLVVFLEIFLRFIKKIKIK